jgi:multidrug efflux pump subunit AcrA (membrane-fusion protein)
MARKLLISVLLILSILGVSVGVTLWMLHTAPEPTEREVHRPQLIVKGLHVEPQTVVEPVEGFGTAQPLRTARLSAQVSGEVVALRDGLNVGTTVHEGDVLVQIDAREYQRQLERAESDLTAVESQREQVDVQERNLKRLIETAERELASMEWEHRQVESLYERGAAPKREFEQSHLAVERTRRTLQGLENELALLPMRRNELEAAIRNRRAEIEIAALHVARCEIRAPFSGEVTEKFVEVGERVQPGASLLSVLDPDIVEVPVKVPVSFRPFLEIGQSCQLFSSGSGRLAWSGSIMRIAPAADAQTRTIEVFVRIDNRHQEHALMPGVFVRARIDGPTWSDVLVVPRGSVHEGRVFVYREGRAVSREVQVTRWFQEQGIVSGLESGDVVITSNLDALYDGAPIRLDGAAHAEDASTDRVVAVGEPSSTPSVDERGPAQSPVQSK